MYPILFTIYLSSTRPLYCLWVRKIAEWVANSVDPDQTPRSAASDLGLHCLLISVCPNTYSKYGNFIKSNPLRNHLGSAPKKNKKNNKKKTKNKQTKNMTTRAQNYKPKKRKATSPVFPNKVIKMLDRIH